MRVSVVTIDFHGGRHSVGARRAVGVVHRVVQIAQRHVLRHVGGRRVVVGVGGGVGRGGGRLRRRRRLGLAVLLVARLHELDYSLRCFHVCHYCCFSLQLLYLCS